MSKLSLSRLLQHSIKFRLRVGRKMQGLVYLLEALINFYLTYRRFANAIRAEVSVKLFHQPWKYWPWGCTKVGPLVPVDDLLDEG